MNVLKDVFYAVTDFLEGFGTTQPFWGVNFMLMKLNTVSWT